MAVVRCSHVNSRQRSSSSSPGRLEHENSDRNATPKAVTRYAVAGDHQPKISELLLRVTEPSKAHSTFGCARTASQVPGRSSTRALLPSESIRIGTQWLIVTRITAPFHSAVGLSVAEDELFHVRVFVPPTR